MIIKYPLYFIPLGFFIPIIFFSKYFIVTTYIFQLQATKKSNSAENSPTPKPQTSQADLQSQVINNGGGLRKGGFSSTPDLKSSTNVPLIPLEELKVKIGVKTSAKTDLDLTLHHHMQVKISGLTTFFDIRIFEYHRYRGCLKNFWTRHSSKSI